MNATMRLTAAVLFFAAVADAFVSPSPRIGVRRSTPTSLDALPEFNPFLLSDGLSAATYMRGDAGGDLTSSLAGGLSALRTFLIVVTAAIFGITAIAYLTAAFLVPKAAEQLERDTRRLRPGLWEEYEAKLEAGETMANRPDLLQELGNFMQPLIVQEYEREAALKYGGKDVMKSESSEVGADVNRAAPPVKEKGAVIDATIVQTEDREVS